MNKLISTLAFTFLAPFAVAHDEVVVDFSACSESMQESVVDSKNMIIRDFKLDKEQFHKMGVSDPIKIGDQYFKRWFYLETENGLSKIEIEYSYLTDEPEDENATPNCESVAIQDYVY